MKVPPWLVSGVWLTLVFGVQAAAGATYYVDSGAAGNDANDGTSVASPWKTLVRVNAAATAPGDSILFVRGGTWTGRLHPQGSGSNAGTVTIDAYGTGALPLIQGAGMSAETLLLDNQAYWDINHLEVTNHAGASGKFVGVRIAAHDAGPLKHVHLVNVEVHDVTGDPADKDTGGILFEITGSGTKTFFDDVLIAGCFVHNVSRTGVALSSSWKKRTASLNTNWVPSTNVVIRDNVIAETASNGLIWRVSSAPLITHNVWAHCSQSVSGNAMFVFNTDNATISHNEAFGTVDREGYHDGGGFDIDDDNKGAIVEYNYAHDNGRAGIVALCSDSGFSLNSVIRFNILQNNGLQQFRVTGHVTRLKVYNNTCYTPASVSPIETILHQAAGEVWPADICYWNNIFVNQSETSSYNLGGSTGTRFDGNLFDGVHPASEPADPHKLTASPELVAPGSGGMGRDTVDGYRLGPGSPALRSGIPVSFNGGVDYFGNSVSSSARPNRGADNGSGGAPPARKNSP